MRIYLIGLPGVGKSTVGKELSLKLEYDFIDAMNESEISDVTIFDVATVSDEITAEFLVDTSKYNEIEDKTAILTIEKADPIVNPKYDTEKIIYEGGGLPEIKLTDGDTEGEISWDDYKLEVGRKEYKWTFIPKDTINYNSITII